MGEKMMKRLMHGAERKAGGLPTITAALLLYSEGALL